MTATTEFFHILVVEFHHKDGNRVCIQTIEMFKTHM